MQQHSSHSNIILVCSKNVQWNWLTSCWLADTSCGLKTGGSVSQSLFICTLSVATLWFHFNQQLYYTTRQPIVDFGFLPSRPFTVCEIFALSSDENRIEICWLFFCVCKMQTFTYSSSKKSESIAVSIAFVLFS